VLVRLIARDEAAQVDAAETFIAQGTWVLDTVLNLSSARVATAIEMLLNHAQLTIQDADAVALALERLPGAERI
jgi:predicted nucleic-acid-binding protein